MVSRIWFALQALLKNAGFRSLRKYAALFLVGVTATVMLGACAAGNSGTSGTSPAAPGSPATASKPDVQLTLVSFAVTKSAHEAVIPKFVAKWKQEKNQNVTFKQSYGGSGSQTRAVIDGLEADIVHLALGSDIQKIEKAGLIEPGWEKEYPSNAVVTKSVAALVTRDGNPKGIKGWSDLAKDGVSWITADPKTSGVARWNFLAVWNAAIKSGSDEAKATEFVGKAYRNVPVLTKDAREATDVFIKQGQGDALINYENEVILAEQKGEKVNYIIPDVNISIDNPIAAVDKNTAKHGNKEVAEAFIKFLYSAEAQQEFAKVGFRPVNPEVAKQKEFAEKFPEVKNLATIDDFGGWSKAQAKFFADGAIFDQIQTNKK